MSSARYELQLQGKKIIIAWYKNLQSQVTKSELHDINSDFFLAIVDLYPAILIYLLRIDKDKLTIIRKY